ncbi:MAG: hypothetical protein LBL20_00585, partial [Treponema sp.]|nr:hypothetical protein [Treponema sp.]
KATRCKHCNSPVDDGSKRAAEDGYINYISSGFSAIEKECNLFDVKVDAITGTMFPRHEYSEEDLVYSPHIKNIRAIASKIGYDLGDWEAKGLVSKNIRAYYESKMNILRRKMSNMLECDTRPLDIAD